MVFYAWLHSPALVDGEAVGYAFKLCTEPVEHLPASADLVI